MNLQPAPEPVAILAQVRNIPPRNFPGLGASVSPHVSSQSIHFELVRSCCAERNAVDQRSLLYLGGAVAAWVWRSHGLGNAVVFEFELDLPSVLFGLAVDSSGAGFE